MRDWTELHAQRVRVVLRGKATRLCANAFPLLLVVLLVLVLSGCGNSTVATLPDAAGLRPPAISATAAMLINPDTGQAYLAQNADQEQVGIANRKWLFRYRSQPTHGEGTPER